MLTNLHVKNLALIEEADVEFGPGLNILTGETGAGKSILLGSINLALGKKMTKDMIREGADSALVELIFQIENERLLEKLKDLEVELSEGQLIITRKLSGGRSISRINGETCTMARLKEVSSLLLDIHGQHDHQSLLYKDKQLEILDFYGRSSLKDLQEQTEERWKEYRKLKKELSEYRLDEEEQAREISFLEFEINEIDEANIIPGEEEELEQRYRRMNHSKTIVQALGSVYQMTGAGDGAGDLCGRSVRELGTVSGYDESLKDLQTMLMDVEALLADFNRDVSRYLEDFTFSEQEFYETENRLDLINHLKAKFGSTTREVLEARDRKQQRLDTLNNYEVIRADLEKKLAEAERRLKEVSGQLSAARKSCAEKLSEEIIQGLKDLNFLDVRFEIGFERTADYGKNGWDIVEFRISTNPGEPIRPLDKVVSGGELSRIMLAIRTILADQDDTDTLIFDEIDTGISGRTAQKVSEKMAEIGNNHQVLCITHLAQIAAMADRHFEIRKQVEDRETVTRIYPLSREESVRELARILGGAEITAAVEHTAGEMKELAEKTKREKADQRNR
ncbi:MAG: DNA repair protein RecN [Lachnospiraceae bacterium]|nr:DNA repair protein RecN [Lachnospiraceae bacterium]